MEEHNTQSHSIIPTFLTKPDQNTSLHVFRRTRRRWRKPLKMHHAVKEMKSNEDDDEDDDEDDGGCVKKDDDDDKQEEKEKEDDDEREEIEKKIHALQRIVPGGESFAVDKLFDETAGYIVALQYQVKALRALTGFFEKLEKEKTKLGG